LIPQPIRKTHHSIRPVCSLLVFFSFVNTLTCRLVIKQKLQTLFLKDPCRPLFWILLGIIVKVFPLIFLLHSRPPSDIPGIWGATLNNDSHSYLDPVENILTNGTYSPDSRMPGYAFVYLPLRLIFSHDISCNILIIMQYLLAGISVYYLGLIAKAIFNNDRIFYICFYLFLFSTYSNYFDGWIMTESFCNSALIFSVWFLVNYYTNAKIKDLLFSGIFLTWAIFLRPVFTPAIFVFLLVLIFQKKKEIMLPVKKIKMYPLYKNLLVFAAPFLLADGIWILYNYSEHQKIIPLESIHPSKRWEENFYKISLFNFITSWGGNYDINDNRAPFLWFGAGVPFNKITGLDSFPEYIYTSQFNRDSLVKVKTKIIALNDSLLSPDRNYAYQSEIKEKLDRYTLSIKAEKPVLYYINAPFFHSLPNFLFGPGSKMYMKRFNLPGKMSFISEYIFTLYYYLVVVFGIVGALFIVLHDLRKNIKAFILAFLPLYSIIIHAIILRYTENKYLMPAWSFLILCTSYFIVVFNNWINRPKTTR
jgi:hypothetical protein